MVVSGGTANIKAVEEIPYEEVIDTSYGGAGALTSTEFKEVGVNLQVTATVTDGNNIFLTVDTEQNVRTGESERGVPVVDTVVAQYLVRAARAASLMGCRPFLVGIRPEIAMVLVELGIDMEGLVTFSDLQSGVEHALRALGIVLVKGAAKPIHAVVR